MKKLLFLIGISALILTSCKSSKSGKSNTDMAVELHALEVFSEIPYRGSRTREVDIIHTALKVRFDWQKQYMYGEATISLKPYFYMTNQIVLDAKGQEIKFVELLDGTLRKVLEYTYVNDVLTIQLDRMYSSVETIKLRIEYIAKPEERTLTKGSAVSEDKGLYFINPLGENPNKPQQLWTQGETEANSVWFPTIDSPNERCTHEIAITVDSKFVTLSNGDMVSSVLNTDGTRTDTWVQNKPIAPYLFMMAVSEFVVVTDSLDGMEVNYYVDPAYEKYAREIFKNTPEMISFYSELLGYDYPWSKYSQVVVHDYVSGAMENVGAVIFGDFVQQTHQEMIDGDNEETVAHELFHHWFGDVVTCESWSNLPLNESFATYGEYLWLEHKYGVMHADDHINNDLENYLYEVNSSGANDLIRFKYQKPDDMFDSHSYAKGGRVLHMLRNYVGDEAFFKSLKMYLHDNEFTAVEIHQLRLAFEKVTGEDLNWFFNQWFMGKGHPILNITYTYDSIQSIQNIRVEQLQNVIDYSLFKLPLDIDIYVDGEVVTYHVVVDSLSQTFSFKVDTKPEVVNFDARKSLICEKTENHTMKEMAFLYANGPLFMDKLEAINFAYEEQESIKSAKKVILDAMMDDYEGIRLVAVQYYDKFDEINDLELKDVLVWVMQTDESSNVRSEAVIALYDYYAWKEGMADVFVGQLKDSSFLVISEVLVGITISDNSLGMEHALEYEESENIEVLLSIAEIYSVFGKENENEFYESLYPKADGYEVLSFINYYSDYLMRIDNISIQEKALGIFEEESKSELIWYVRYYAVNAMTELQVYYESMAKIYKKDGQQSKSDSYQKLVSRIDKTLSDLRVTEEDQRVFRD